MFDHWAASHRSWATQNLFSLCYSNSPNTGASFPKSSTNITFEEYEPSKWPGLLGRPVQTSPRWPSEADQRGKQSLHRSSGKANNKLMPREEDSLDHVDTYIASLRLSTA